MRRGWYVLGELDEGLRDKAELRLESNLEQSLSVPPYEAGLKQWLHARESTQPAELLAREQRLGYRYGIGDP